MNDEKFEWLFHLSISFLLFFLLFTIKGVKLVDWFILADWLWQSWRKRWCTLGWPSKHVTKLVEIISWYEYVGYYGYISIRKVVKEENGKVSCDKGSMRSDWNRKVGDEGSGREEGRGLNSTGGLIEFGKCSLGVKQKQKWKGCYSQSPLSLYLFLVIICPCERSKIAFTSRMKLYFSVNKTHLYCILRKFG